MKSHNRLPKDGANRSVWHWVLLDIVIYSGEFAKHRWVKGLAQDNRSHMMEILISISAPRHQLISGKGRWTKKKNIHTLPAYRDFQPHINLRIHLLDIWYLCLSLEKKCFHANQNCNSPNENKNSRTINIISYLFFKSIHFPFPLGVVNLD